MKNHRRFLFLASFVLLMTASAAVLPPRTNIFAEKGLVHILGPSPAISPNPDIVAVDSSILESCDIIKDRSTYYWYYHAQSKDKTRWPRGYRICVATAPTPLGPWTRYAQNPVLDQGAEGSWDYGSVDGAVILKEGSYDLKSGTEKYYMWYSAGAPKPGQKRGTRHIGLATASSPLGPWKKFEHNPVVEDFGYLGGVVKVNGKFMMFVQDPIGVTDQGPFRVATADKPEGPWTKYPGNPVLTPGDWGAWDDGGYSESRVRYHEGIFHCFYGGTKTSKFESIGYAYSFDGFKWTKYAANPVVDLSRVPDAAGLAEVHAYIEGPYVYLYHTLRYFTGKGTARGLSSYPSSPWTTEDLGVQVLTIDPRFKIALPVLSIDSLAPKQSTRIEECLPIGLESASTLALSVECRYYSEARAGLTLHVRASTDGLNYDTVDLETSEIPAAPGTTVRKTIELSPRVRYVKVFVTNHDESQTVRGIRVNATVGN